MSLDPVKNFAKVTVSQGYAAGVTTIVLNTGDGTKLPSPASDGAFNLVWWNVSSYTNPIDDPYVEIVRCTGKVSDTLTIIRAQEGTSDVAHNISGKTYKMILAPTKKLRDDIQTTFDAKQPLDATLTSIALLGTAADKMLYTTGVDTWAEAAITAFARSVLDDADAATATTTLGLGSGNSPVFAGLTLSGLTASLPAVTDANKAFVSLAYTGATSFRANLGLEPTDSPTFAGLDLTGLTDGYVPYIGVGASANSPIYTDGINVSIGTTTLGAKLEVDQTAAADILTMKDGGTVVQKIYDGGITDLPFQSGCRVRRETAQTIATATMTVIQFDIKSWDIHNEYDSITNFRFTATKGGKYLVIAEIMFTSVAWAAGNHIAIELFKNGVTFGRLNWRAVEAAITTYMEAKGTDEINLAANDYIDIRVDHDRGASTDLHTDPRDNYLIIKKLN